MESVAITADKVREFVESSQSKTAIHATKKTLVRIASALSFVNGIKNDLPHKDDSQLTSAIKLIGLVSNLLAKIPDKEDSAMARISKAFALKERYNPGLMDIIHDFNLLHDFSKFEMPDTDTQKSFADKWGKVLLFSHPDIGVIGLRDTLSEVSSTILHSEDFTTDAIWKLVWAKTDGCVDIQPGGVQYKTFRFSKYSIDEGQQFGSAKERINDFIEKNRKFISMGFERSYLFLGPPGSGKTTFSQKFARAYSKKILQFSPEVVWGVNEADTIRLIQESGAEVLLIDEIDKLITNMNAHSLGQLLSRFEKFRRCRPGLITIFTANTVDSFPDAMLRPGRIDDIIEFSHPNPEDRRAILEGYAKALDVEMTEDAIEKITKTSEGLTGAWLKEVIIQAKVSDALSVCSLIEKMLKYARKK